MGIYLPGKVRLVKILNRKRWRSYLSSSQAYPNQQPPPQLLGECARLPGFSREEARSPHGFVQFVTRGTEDSVSAMFTLVALAPQIARPPSRGRPREPQHTQRVGVIVRSPELGKTPVYKRIWINLSIHPLWEYLYYPDQETNLPTDSERDTFLITLDCLQRGWETSFIILQNKPICVLPRATLQISLNKAVPALCSEAIQKCRNSLSTLPLNMFCFDDSNLAWVLEEHKPVFFHWLQKINLSV